MKIQQGIWRLTNGSTLLAVAVAAFMTEWPCDGAQNPVDAIAPIRVNEVLSHHTNPPRPDAIELYNPTSSDVDVGGWFLTDDFRDPMKYRIANGTIVPARGYQVFDETHFNSNPGVPPSFEFSSMGGEAFLLSGDPAGTNLTGYFHGWEFGAAEDGVSFGTHFILCYSFSEEYFDFVAQSALTLGAVNAGPRVGPVVIAEFHRPSDVSGQDNVLDEFIELHNLAGVSVPLFDPLNPVNTWILSNAVFYVFPSDVTLATGEIVLVVSFDPAVEVEQLTAFRARYNVPEGVRVFGPWQGKLDNNGKPVEFYRPVTPESQDIPYVLVDAVDYHKEVAGQMVWRLGMWLAAEGHGPSLQRRGSYGNDQCNWAAAEPTAGTSFVPGQEPIFVSQPRSQSVVALQDATFSVSVFAPGGPLFYQWLFNGENIEGATGSSYTRASALPEHAGDYSAVVWNRSGAQISLTAHLTVLAISAPWLTDASRLEDGSFRFSFTNTAGATFAAVATSNMTLNASNWNVLGPATETAPGQYQFTDPGASAHPRRIYLIRAP